MGEALVPDNADEQLSELGLDAPGGDEAPVTPGAAGQGEGQGQQWSPEQQAAYTQATQKYAAEVAGLNERLARAEAQADMYQQAAQPPQAPPEPDVPMFADGKPIDVDFSDKVFRATPAFRGIVEAQRRIDQMVQENAIQSGLEAQKDDPYYSETRQQAEGILRQIASVPGGVPVNRQTVDVVYKATAYDKARSEISETRSKAAEARETRKQAQAQAGSPGSSSTLAAPPPDMSSVSDEELREMLVANPVLLAEVMSGKSG